MDTYWGRQNNGLQRCPSIIPGVYEYVNLHEKRDFTDVLTGMHPEMGRVLWIIQVVPVWSQDCLKAENLSLLCSGRGMTAGVSSESLVTLLALKMKQGTVSHGWWEACNAGKTKETFSLRPPERTTIQTTPWVTLGTTRPIIWLTDLYDNKLVLFQASKFVFICYSSSKKKLT